MWPVQQTWMGRVADLGSINDLASSMIFPKIRCALARCLAAWIFLALLIPFSAGSVSTSIDTLLNKAEEIRSSDPAQLQRLLEQLNATTVKSTLSQRERLAYLNAYQDAFQGHFAQAIAAANRLLTTSSDVAMQFRAGALAVNSYALTGQYGKGLRQLDQTLSLLKYIQDKDLQQLGYSVAATLYNQVGQYQLGRHYAELVTSAPASERWLCFANFMKFDAMLHLQALSSDDKPLLAAISQCAEHSEMVMAGFIRATLARKWASNGQDGEALELLQQYLPAATATGYPRLIAEFSSQIAELQLAGGDLAGAKMHAEVVTEQGSGVLNTPPLVSAYSTLYQIAERRHQPDVALAYYQQYADAKMAFLSDVKARELAYHLARQETEHKSQQIELLNRRNAVLELQQQVDQASAQNSRLLMLLMALMAATIGYWGYKTRRMHTSLRHMAQVDALTGVCNRHHFTVLAEKSLSQCAVAGEPAALLMFDLDHFKAINDSYGHTTGDWVLKRVADTCKQFCRRIDHLGRLGGEEFAILLHGCDLHVATRLAEDCRVRIAAIDTKESGYRFTVTASFGVSATSLSGYDLAKLLSHADLMLYRAKREGRNRVRTYAPDMPITLRPQVASQPGETTPAPAAPMADLPPGHLAS